MKSPPLKTNGSPLTFCQTIRRTIDDIQLGRLAPSLPISPKYLKGRIGHFRIEADLHPTTYELRLSILQAKAEQLGSNIPMKVMEFLAHKITSSARELEGALNRIAAHATLVGRDITLAGTQEVLHDLLRASDRHITIEEIQKRAAKHYNIRISDMHSARRARAVDRPRQVGDVPLEAAHRPLTARDRP